jgi:peptidoglycan/LPS O-acetylase OafA/YrhL
VLGDLPEPLQWTVALAVLGILSVVSYHLLEKPAIDFGARPYARQSLVTMGELA